MFKTFIKQLTIILLLIFAVVPGYSKTDNSKEFTIIIDAGHGGKDIGATDNGVKEKDINLKVAKYLESLIRKKLKNSKVVMTRDNDTYLTLQYRADVANRNHGDIFVSIHTNSVDKKNRNRKNIAGSSVYTLGLHKDDNNLAVAMRENSVIELEQDYEQKYSGFDPQRDESYIIFEMAQKKNLSQSIRLAENIEKELVNSGRQDRGIHQAGFWVLWATSMPSVLVELDFICNPSSAQYISSDKGAKELAEAIFKALQKYESSWRKAMNGATEEALTDTYKENSNSETTDNLTDTYNGSSNVLEDSYSVVSQGSFATAKTRKHKTQTSPRVKTDKRRRRSLSSKELSLMNSYEVDNLVFSGMYENTSAGKPEEEEILAMASSTEEIISSNPKENKKKENSKNKKKKVDKKKEKKVKEAKEDKKQKKRKEDAYNAKVNKLVTVYKIQILASADLLSQSNSRFCGLSPITTYKENNLYKYYYGESTDREEMEQELVAVRRKIPDAFIVASQKSIRTN